MNELVVPVGAALACGVAALGVPALIARIPEPDHEAEDDRAPKVPYTVIAASPRLAWTSALVAVVVGGSIGFQLGAAWELLYLLPLVPVSVALAVVDWRTQLLPTRVLAPTYLVTIALVLVCWSITRETDHLVDAGLGWLVLGGLYFLLWFIYPPGMGYGDVRLSGVLGIALGYLGWDAVYYGTLAGLIIGGLGGLALSLLKIVDRKNSPFGPFMLLGAWVGVLVG